MKLTNINFTATDSQFRVLVDGEEVSRHNMMHKAQERATNELLNNPDSDVRYVQELSVIAKGDFKSDIAKSKIISFTTE